MRAGAVEVEVRLGVYGDHQVTNALCAGAVALECGAGVEQVAAALAGAGPVSRHRMQVTTRADGVTVIDDAYNANPDSMRAGLQALAWIAHGGAQTRRSAAANSRRSWAVLGEMAELGEDAITEHDRIGRLAVRLDVSRLVVVGTGRSMSAMHHGAVMEGSWGQGEAVNVADGDAALALLRAEVQPGDVVLVKASNAAGLGALADALAMVLGWQVPAPIAGARAHETDPHRRRHRADRVDPVDPALIRLFTKQGFGHQIREDGPPSHHTKRGTPSMGGVAILAGIWAGYLGTHLAGLAFDGEGISASGLLVLGLATALGGVGFIDDLIKIRRSRNLGLNKTAKTVGQITSAVLFGVLVLQFRNPAGLTPASADCPTCARSPPSRWLRRCSCCSAWSSSAPGPTRSTSPTAWTGWPPAAWRWSPAPTC